MGNKNKGQTEVTIYPDWCKGCGICAAFCPGKVMEMNQLGKAVVVNEEGCINCGFCELHCPDFAISVQPKDPDAAQGLAPNRSRAANGATEAGEAEAPRAAKGKAAKKMNADTPAPEKGGKDKGGK